MINSKEELPERWMVRVTEENINILNEYRYKHYCKDNNLQNFMYMANRGSGHNGGFGYKEITFEEFKKYVLGIQEEQFPKDDFGVIVENYNGKQIIDYLKSKGFTNINCFDGSMEQAIYGIRKNTNNIWWFSTEFNEFSKLYTLQQLKQLDNMKKTREIEYYIVKVDALYGKNGNLFIRYEKIYNTNKESLPYFKSLGLTENPNILEPVYAPEKPKEVIVNMGSFNLTVKPEGIFHKSENITSYVEGIEFWWKNNCSSGNLKLGIKNYDCLIPASNITIEKSGCESNQTKLSQWLAVWEEYIKIKY